MMWGLSSRQSILPAIAADTLSVVVAKKIVLFVCIMNIYIIRARRGFEKVL
jgi:hypothetical protein